MNPVEYNVIYICSEVDCEENDEPECDKTGDDFEEDVKTVRITHNFSKMTDMVAWDIIAEMEENNNYSSAIIGIYFISFL